MSILLAVLKALECNKYLTPLLKFLYWKCLLLIFSINGLVSISYIYVLLKEIRKKNKIFILCERIYLFDKVIQYGNEDR